MNIYKIKMRKTTFFKNSDKIVAQSISLIDGHVFFKTDSITKTYLDDNKINYKVVDTYTNKLKRKLNNYFVLIILFISFLMICYINSFRVKNIVFNGEYKINSKIEDDIKEKYRHFLFWDFININYENLSKNLRSKYSDYEWIEVKKIGNKIVVNINNNTDVSNNISVGQIVSKKDSIVKSFKVYNGKAVIHENDYVKKGDLLINYVDESLNKEPRGVVLGYCYDIENISVLKEEKVSSNTGNRNKYYDINLFKLNFKLGKKNKYKNYNLNKKIVFNFFNVFKVYRIEETEIYDIIKMRNEKEALDEAIDKIKNDFLMKKTLEEEKILKTELLFKEEDSNNYHFKIIIKTVESIGQFKEL